MGREEPRSAAGSLAAAAADIGAERRGVGSSQTVVGLACRMAAGIEAADTAALAGHSQQAEHRRKTHGGTFPRTSDQRWGETASGSHTGSGLVASSLVVDSPAADTEGSPVVPGGIGAAAKPAADSHSSDQGRQPCRRSDKKGSPCLAEEECCSCV